MVFVSGRGWLEEGVIYLLHFWAVDLGDFLGWWVGCPKEG